MEIEITLLVKQSDRLIYYSASAAELGQDACKVTWENSKDADDLHFLKTESDLAEFRDWIKDSGGWSKEEIAAWDSTECNALLLQFISGDLREYLDFRERGLSEFRRYKQQYGGSIYKGSGGKYFFMVSH